MSIRHIPRLQAGLGPPGSWRTTAESPYGPAAAAAAAEVAAQKHLRSQLRLQTSSRQREEGETEEPRCFPEASSGLMLLLLKENYYKNANVAHLTGSWRLKHFEVCVYLVCTHALNYEEEGGGGGVRKGRNRAGGGVFKGRNEEKEEELQVGE